MWYRKTGDNANFIGQYRIFCQKMRQFFFWQTIPQFFFQEIPQLLQEKCWWHAALRDYLTKKHCGDFSFSLVKRVHGPYIRWQIVDGIRWSEHVAHASRKIGLFGEKNPICARSRYINQSNNRNRSLRAHLFLSYHLIYVQCSQHTVLPVIENCVEGVNAPCEMPLLSFLQLFYIVLQPQGLVIAKTVNCKNMLSAKAVIPNIAFNCR